MHTHSHTTYTHTNTCTHTHTLHTYIHMHTHTLHTCIHIYIHTYIHDYQILATGGAGSDFLARFRVSFTGEITTIIFDTAGNHGTGYTANPALDVYYPDSTSCDASGVSNPSTTCKQDGTVLSVDVGIVPFLNPLFSFVYVTAATVVSCVAPCVGDGFFGTCNIITNAPAPLTNPLLVSCVCVMCVFVCVCVCMCACLLR
jgi:hypothetical protein